MTSLVPAPVFTGDCMLGSGGENPASSRCRQNKWGAGVRRSPRLGSVEVGLLYTASKTKAHLVRTAHGSEERGGKGMLGSDGGLFRSVGFAVVWVSLSAQATAVGNRR